MVAKRLSLTDEVVYSTNPEFEYEYASIKEPETLPPGDQTFIISLEKRRLDGALVTRVSGFVGKRMDLLKIEQELQQVCRTCGSTRKYDVVLVRDVRKRAYVYLRNQGFGVQFAVS
jgi:translation initiation factor 1